MIALRALAIIVLLIMLSVTGWASARQALWAIPVEVRDNPWFIATLADAYCGFLIFFAWIACRETTWRARAGWFVAMMTLGNIASAAYLLLALNDLQTKFPANTPPTETRS